MDGYWLVPPITRLGLNFTILAWVKLHSYRNHQRLLDFGNGASSNNVLISISGTSTGIYFHNYVGSTNHFLNSNTFLSLYNWHHLGFIVKGGSSLIYLNGSLLISKNHLNGNIVQIINRTKCFIGKSNWQDPNADSEFDDIKIYDGVLSSDQIMDEFLTDLN